ncbi:hypothetical protein C1I95_14795 [Micromonospora craterilacus]|uniref:Uncharacterized protein n=1 Tax=Micromonospora craterilacus TaxID=1655439 RepID=A0A2W2EMK1_9ACTN|nr:hypothetical protein [Micromonospora craterilacus]PZG17815.1 hypothetical protein C1I95_14795 [Micromonospora craterilacus]
MPGQPQLRESSWLYMPGDDIPYALIRVEQRMDDSGIWDVLVNHPASAPTTRAERTDGEAAYAEAVRQRDTIAGLYRDQHGVTGQWRIRRPEAY